MLRTRVVIVLAAAAALTACTSALSGTGHRGSVASSSRPPSPTRVLPTPSFPTSAPTSSTPPVPANGLAACVQHPDTCNSGTPRKGGTLSFGLIGPLSGWNAKGVNDTLDLESVLHAILPSAFVTEPDLAVVRNKELLSSVRQVSARPQTIVYQVKPSARWGDGVPIGAADFSYAAALGKLGRYDGYADIKSITGSHGGKTVRVVMKTFNPDWAELFDLLYPAHIALHHGTKIATSSAWLDNHVPVYTGGPYKIVSATAATGVKLVPNPKWYGPPAPLDHLNFTVVGGGTEQAQALGSGRVNVVQPFQPDGSVVAAVKHIATARYVVTPGAAWEHLDLNPQSGALRNKALRAAILTAVDRQAIIRTLVAPFAPGTTPLGNHMLLPQQLGYTDNISGTGQGSGDLARAKVLLQKAHFTFSGATLRTPAGKPVLLRCSYLATNQVREQTCQLLQAELAKIGIRVTAQAVTNLTDSLLHGHYDMMVYAWVGTPFAATAARDLFSGTGQYDYLHNHDSALDKLLTSAYNAKTAAAASAALNTADRRLTSDAVELPLYRQPSLLALTSDVVNVRNNTGPSGVSYNVGEWGLR